MNIKNLILFSTFALILFACGGDNKSKNDGSTFLSGFGNKASAADFPSSCDAGESLFKTKDDLDSVPTGLFRVEARSAMNGSEFLSIISCQKVEDTVGGRMVYSRSLSDSLLTKSFFSSDYLKEVDYRRFLVSGRDKLSIEPQEINSAQFNQALKNKPLIKIGHYNKSGDLVSHTHMVADGDSKVGIYSMTIIRIPNKPTETNFSKTTFIKGDSQQINLNYTSKLVDGKIVQTTSGTITVAKISASWKLSQTIWKLQ